MLKYHRCISLMSDTLQGPIGKFFEKKRRPAAQMASIGSCSLYIANETSLNLFY